MTTNATRQSSGPASPDHVLIEASARSRRRVSLVSAGIGSLTSAMLLCGWGVRIGVEETTGARETRITHESVRPYTLPAEYVLVGRDTSDGYRVGSPADWRQLRAEFDQLSNRRSRFAVDADRRIRTADSAYASQIDLLRRLAETRRAAANGESALALAEFADQHEALQSVLEQSRKMMDDVDEHARDPQSESAQRQKWYVQSRFGKQAAELQARMDEVFARVEADVARNQLQAAELLDECAQLERERVEVVAAMDESARAELAAIETDLNRLEVAMHDAYRRDAARTFARKQANGGTRRMSLAMMNDRAASHIAEIMDRLEGGGGTLPTLAEVIGEGDSTP